MLEKGVTRGGRRERLQLGKNLLDKFLAEFESEGRSPTLVFVFLVVSLAFLKGLRKAEAQIFDEGRWERGGEMERLAAFAAHPQFRIIHAVRWTALIYELPTADRWIYKLSPVIAAFSKGHGPQDLRAIAVALSALGFDSNLIGRGYLSLSRYIGLNPLFRVPSECLWPYFGERLDLLEQALRLSARTGGSDYMANYHNQIARVQALKVLGVFPHAPERLTPILWEIALQGSKAERRLAQTALQHQPELNARVVLNLSHGQSEIRAEAAAWLGRIGDAAQAVPALRAASKKEKKETTLGSMLSALETLGTPIEALIDRAALAKEAERQSSHALPPNLEWFPFSNLPAVRWAKDDTAVPLELLRLFVVQSHKLKNPEPGPVLRTYARLFRSDDRAHLGRFVVEAWIAHDTAPLPPVDAAKKAKAAWLTMRAHQMHNPSTSGSGNTEESDPYYQSMYHYFLTSAQGSAIASKGVLAVAGACAAADTASIVYRYIKLYYGMRSAQAKALLQMLAWIDDPAAIQILLTIGNRFRTKGIQEEASRLCKVLAERKAWTLDELSDRTVPTAGFDEEGHLELKYGTRTFTATLGGDLEITLTNSDGKEITALPEPSKTDDEPLAAAAKKTLSGARKEVKAVIKFQSERLYEALCTQRQWSYEDFRRFLLVHPIVGRLCEQVVWSVVEANKTVLTFRPMSDKSLTDCRDGVVTVSDDAKIRLAHEATADAKEREDWARHFSDYEVIPLFQQFGKPLYSLPPDQNEATELDAFVGHVVEAFKLRGRLTKLGYTRGSAQDGGYFSEYHKRFPGLSLQATINFSGNQLPEENKLVALASLTFQRISEEPDGNGGAFNTPLGELPTVLLSECWNDLRLAAAEGKGFDPEWEKTVAP